MNLSGSVSVRQRIRGGEALSLALVLLLACSGCRLLPRSEDASFADSLHAARADSALKARNKAGQVSTRAGAAASKARSAARQKAAPRRESRPVASRVPLPEPSPEALPEKLPVVKPMASPSAPAKPTAADVALNVVRRDLKNLEKAQAQYLAAQGIYARRVQLLQLQYLPHRGVTVSILGTTASGWSARASHAAVKGKSCVMYVGLVSSLPKTDEQRLTPPDEGDVVCDAVGSRP